MTTLAPPPSSAPKASLADAREVLRAARGRAAVAPKGCGAGGCNVKRPVPPPAPTHASDACRCDVKALRAGARAGRQLREHVVAMGDQMDALILEVESLRGARG